MSRNNYSINNPIHGFGAIGSFVCALGRISVRIGHTVWRVADMSFGEINATTIKQKYTKAYSLLNLQAHYLLLS